MKDKPIFKNTFINFTILYLLVITYIAPWGEFAVNDDWDFFITTKRFITRDFTLGSQTDAAFTIQGLIGMVWSYWFGHSFTSLRVLTILVSILTLFGIYKLLLHYKVKKNVIVLALGTVAFNPLFFVSALSFMTEMYFLCTTVWSVWFFVRSIQHGESIDSRNFVIAAFFAGLSIYIRQFGVILFAAYFFVVFLYRWKYNYKNSVPLLSLILFLNLSVFPLQFWPRISPESQEYVFNAENYERMKLLFPFLLSYFGLFLSPILLLLTNQIRKVDLLLVGFFTSIYSNLFYSKDIFPIGNIFYIERLFAKSNFVHYISLFDNIPFKVVLVLLVSFLASILTVLFIKNFRSVFKIFNSKFIPLIVVAMSFIFLVLGASIFVGEFYDRYLINGFIFSIILAAILTKRKVFFAEKYYNVSLVLLILLTLITTFLAKDFYTSENLRWEVGRSLQQQFNLDESVFVNGSFSRYNHYQRFRTAEDTVEYGAVGNAYTCFVHSYNNEENGNLIYRILHRFENSRTLNKYITNPKIYETKLTAGVEPIGWHWDDIILEETYSSPIYSFLGVKPVVGAYCDF